VQRLDRQTTVTATRSGFVTASAVTLVSLALLLVGGWLTSLGLGPWYRGLDFPPFQPPGWVFSPVWAVIFVLLARSTWLVLQSDGSRISVAFALGLYGAQCVLNVGWSLLFFTLKRPDVALWELLVLDATVAAMVVVYARSSRSAAALLLPYLAWVCFATAINAWIVKYNGPF
jgi:tryptophan-rich sensory protein